MQERSDSVGNERRQLGERRGSGDASATLYDRLDQTIDRIEANRRTRRRRQGDDDAVRIRRMSLGEVWDVAADVIKAENPRLAVIGLAGSGGSTRYIEMLLHIRGCQVEPCRLAIDIDRIMPPPQLRELLTRRIREHLHDRTADSAAPSNRDG